MSHVILRSDQEEDEYVQGRGGEFPQAGRPQGLGRRQQQQRRGRVEGWYNDDVVNGKNATRKDKKKLAMTMAAKKNINNKKPREESCGVVELVYAMLALKRMYRPRR